MASIKKNFQAVTLTLRIGFNVQNQKHIEDDQTPSDASLHSIFITTCPTFYKHFHVPIICNVLYLFIYPLPTEDVIWDLLMILHRTAAVSFWLSIDQLLGRPMFCTRETEMEQANRIKSQS